MLQLGRPLWVYLLVQEKLVHSVSAQAAHEVALQRLLRGLVPGVKSGATCIQLQPLKCCLQRFCKRFPPTPSSLCGSDTMGSQPITRRAAARQLL